MENHLFVNQLTCTFHLQVVTHVAQYSWDLIMCELLLIAVLQYLSSKNLMTFGKQIILCNVVDIEENESQVSLIFVSVCICSLGVALSSWDEKYTIYSISLPDRTSVFLTVGTREDSNTSVSLT